MPASTSQRSASLSIMPDNTHHLYGIDLSDHISQPVPVDHPGEEQALTAQDDLAPSTLPQQVPFIFSGMLQTPAKSVLEPPHVEVPRDYSRELPLSDEMNNEEDSSLPSYETVSRHAPTFFQSLLKCFPLTVHLLSQIGSIMVSSKVAPIPCHPLTSSQIGPRSMMSICSPPAIAWVTSRVQAPGIRESIRSFTRKVTMRLKIQSHDSMTLWQRSPEPSIDLARCYTEGMPWERHVMGDGLYERCIDIWSSILSTYNRSINWHFRSIMVRREATGSLHTPPTRQ